MNQAYWLLAITSRDQDLLLENEWSCCLIVSLSINKVWVPLKVDILYIIQYMVGKDLEKNYFSSLKCR